MLTALAERLITTGDPLAEYIVDSVTSNDSTLSGSVGFALAAVREGYELHYGETKLLKIDDPDLRLLAGDRMYAIGLERLAIDGMSDQIAVLSEVIRCCAECHARNDQAGAVLAWQHGRQRLKRLQELAP